jgi:transcriptional regulator with XRE-family HTH domain
MMLKCENSPGGAEMNERALLVGVANRLRTLRTAIGLTQAELAARSGTTPQMISNVERCCNWLSIPQLVAIAQGLGVPVSCFFQEGDADEKIFALRSMLESLEIENINCAVKLRSAIGMLETECMRGDDSSSNTSSMTPL